MAWRVGVDGNRSCILESRFQGSFHSHPSISSSDLVASLQRFIDMIPRRVEHKLNREFNDSLTERLRTEIMDKTSSESVEVLMEENREIAEKRAKLQDTIQRLKEVEELVGAYRVGVDDEQGEEDDGNEEIATDSDIDSDAPSIVRTIYSRPASPDYPQTTGSFGMSPYSYPRVQVALPEGGSPSAPRMYRLTS